MNIQYKLLLCNLCLFFVSPSQSALAEDAYLVLLGKGVGVAGGVVDAVKTGNSIEFTGSARHSYCCEVWTKPGVSKVAITSVIDNSWPEGGPIWFTHAGSADPKIFTSFGANSQEEARACFVLPQYDGIGEDHSVSLSLEIVNQNEGQPDDTAYDVRFFCDDTTLFGGFNTMVTDFNFLELTNTISSLDLNVTLRLMPVKGEPFERTVLVKKGSRFDMDIHSLVGPGTYGSMQLMHDGPKGGLKAELVQYRITSQDPLKFDPVSRQTFTRQDQ